MATITFEMADKDVETLLRRLAESSGEPIIWVRVRLAHRARGEHQPISLIWEVEMIPNNGGVYRMLLEGGQHEQEGSYNHSGE